MFKIILSFSAYTANAVRKEYNPVPIATPNSSRWYKDNNHSQRKTDPQGRFGKPMKWDWKPYPPGVELPDKPPASTQNFTYNGIPIDIHDGIVVQFNNTFYWYGMQYTYCTNGYSADPGQQWFFDTVMGIGTERPLWMQGMQCPYDIYKFSTLYADERCGFKTVNEGQQPVIWKSKNMVDWEPVHVKHGHQGKRGIRGAITNFGAYANDLYVRPQVAYNDWTKKFVMWLNRLPMTRPAPENLDTTDRIPVDADHDNMIMGHKTAGFLVATSDSPEGPFEIVNVITEAKYPGIGDINLLQMNRNTKNRNDGNRTAVMIFNAWTGPDIKPNPVLAFFTNIGFTIMNLFSPMLFGHGKLFTHLPDDYLPAGGHRLMVQVLNDEYTDIIEKDWNYVILSLSNSESPAAIDHPDNKIVYGFGGHTCCYCRMGSNVGVYVFTDPVNHEYLIGASLHQRNNPDELYDINPEYVEVDGTTYRNPEKIQIQLNSVFPFVDENNKTRFILTGDMWGTGTGMKFDYKMLNRPIMGAHHQYWHELHFEDAVCEEYADKEFCATLKPDQNFQIPKILPYHTPSAHNNITYDSTSDWGVCRKDEEKPYVEDNLYSCGDKPNTVTPKPWWQKWWGIICLILIILAIAGISTLWGWFMCGKCCCRDCCCCCRRRKDDTKFSFRRDIMPASFSKKLD